MREESGTLDRGDGTLLAWRRIAGGKAPGVVFLGGFNSDMTGTKAEALAETCAAEGRPFLRFDYSGHGASGGRFVEGTIGQWAADATLCFDRLTEGRQVLVGSSMGGWMAMLVAQRRAARVAGLIGIAAAPDFTKRITEMLPEAARAEMARTGVWLRPSEYGDPYPIGRRLLEEGNDHLLLEKPLDLRMPIRLLHGQRDDAVPWQLSLQVAAHVASTDVEVTLVKDGDHRLSRPQDIALLRRTLTALLAQDGA